MNNTLQSIKQVFINISSIRIMDIIDILIVAFLAYLLISLIRKTRINKVFQGIIIILAALWLSGELHLYTVNFLLRNMVQIGLIALVVLFQPEIRRFLEKIGSSTSISSLLGSFSEKKEDTAVSQTVLACLDMSASRTGALIIFERENHLDEQIRTGTIINADPAAELFKNIFYNKAPMHDGAVIMRNGRIHAAGCMLPLSSNTNLSKELGMRHRAGIGMSEVSDAVVVIVSEETGAISVAIDGMLKRHLSRDTFEKILSQELLVTQDEQIGKTKGLFRKEKEASDGSKH